MADPLVTALSGLLSFQRALSTTSHNISNVNTEGYSRQRVDFATRPPEFSGSGYYGTGVRVDAVQRVYDQFLVDQVRTSTSALKQAEDFHELASQVDNLIAGANSGLTPNLESFFAAMQGVADYPSSIPAREVLLGEAGMLVDRFQYVDQRLAERRTEINSGLQNHVLEINDLTTAIAGINRDIVLATGNGNQQLPNDLLDRRDMLIGRLAEHVSVTTVGQDDGAMNVFIGKGQAVVTGFQSQSLSVVSDSYDPLRYEVAYVSGTGNVTISDQLTGGSLGGLLDFRNRVLDPAQNAVGRVAIGLADSFNDQHKLGMDLDGALGGAFFTVASPQVLDNTANTGTATVTAAVVSVSDLTTSDYRLTYDGANVFTLLRLSDNTTTTINTGGSYPYTTEEVDGLAVTITAGAVATDSFLIQPTRKGAEDIAVAIIEPRDVAAAAPIRTVATLANIGNGTISAGTVNSPNNRVTITFDAPPNTFNVVDNTTGATLAQDVAYVSGNNISFNGWTMQISDGTFAPAAGDTFIIDKTVTTAGSGNTNDATISAATVNAAGSDPNLTDTVTITFDNPPTTFTVAGATTGTPVASVPHTSGQPISYNGWTVSISGTPVAGDVFTVRPNTGGVSDNRNALLLADLQAATTLGGGTASYNDAYAQAVADVSIKTRQAEANRDVQDVLLSQATEAREAMSGVNLDEEAANLLRFQQAYQAVAQVISTSDRLFQEIIGVFRN